jgi:hypothetical protein
VSAGDTSNSVANAALLYIGYDGGAVTGFAPNFDSSTPGKALAGLYEPCVETVARQFGWDFGRAVVALTLTGNVAPVPWAYEYLYPSNGVELWQLQPPTVVDPNNPLPVNWSVGNNEVSSVQTKVVWTNLVNAVATYHNNPTEATWDPGFREAVVRLLASELAGALAGKPDMLQTMLESGSAMEQQAEARPD